MPGIVVGSHFKRVLGHLIGDDHAAPELRARLAQTPDELELPWPEFVEVVAQTAAEVGRARQVEAGRSIIRELAPELRGWGVKSLDELLSDWSASWRAIIRDAPADQALITVSFRPGYALFRAGRALPRDLLAGQLCGALKLFHAELSDLDCHRIAIDGLPYHLFELRWRGGAQPQARPRQSWAALSPGAATP